MILPMRTVAGCRLPDFPAITDDDYLTAFDQAMAAQRAGLEAIATAPGEPDLDLIHAWEHAGQDLTTVANAFWTRKDADTTERLDEIEAIVAPQLAGQADAIWLDRRLYDKLVRLQQRLDAGDVSADAEDRWWLAEQLRGYRRHGIDLAEADQARLKAINQRLTELETAYAAAVVKGRTAAAIHLTDPAELAGLAESDIAAAKRAADDRGLPGWVIELVNTTNQPLLARLDNRATRRRVFEASISRGLGGPYDTRATIIELARLRAEEAQLLGFEHFAAYIADDGCAKTTAAVMDLLTRAAAASFANGRREAADLQRHLTETDPDATLEPWDWAWLAARARRADYDLDEAALMPYLAFDTVLENGVFAAANRLYGLTFTQRDDVPGYTPDCRTYQVDDADGSVLGLLQLDPYARTSKQGGAWMTNLTDQAHLSGDRPVVTNNCNLTRPAAGRPALMTWDQVTTLFHEFGHDLHGLLADSRYASLSGSNTPRDYVEFPSQVNEMWAWEPTVLAGFGRRYDTGQALPAAVRDQLLASRLVGEGFAAAELYAAMLLDQVWHQTPLDQLPSAPDEVEAFEQAALARFDAPDLIPPRYRSGYFSHIWGGGYAAGYYGYLWAAVLDADTGAWFEEHGGLTRQNGDTFRRAVLAVGGSGDVMAAYRSFRGTEPDPVHLFRRRGLLDDSAGATSSFPSPTS